MKITANIRVDEKAMMDPNLSQIASGWVELEDFIKFPVRVRKYTDKKDNKEKLFVSYPQRKTDEGYVPVVSPEWETKNEIEEYVLEEVKKQIVKGIDAPPVTEVKIMLPDREKWNLSENVTALASVKIAGVNIHGIMIKKGRNGLFVQMPQYQANGEYKDTVYGTSSFAQSSIKRAILEAYEEKFHRREPDPPAVEEENVAKMGAGTKEMNGQGGNDRQPEKESTKESIERLISDYEQKNIEKLLSDIKHVVFVEEKKSVNSSGMVESQVAYIRSADSTDYIRAEFTNNYDGVVSEKEPAECEITIVIYKQGEYAGWQTIYRCEGVTPEEAEKSYQETMGIWEKMTSTKAAPEEKAYLDETEGRDLLLAAYDAGDSEGMRVVLETAGNSPELVALYKELTGEQIHIRKSDQPSVDAPRL